MLTSSPAIRPLLGLCVSISLCFLPCCPDFSDEGYHGKLGGKLGESGSVFWKVREGGRERGGTSKFPSSPLPVCHVSFWLLSFLALGSSSQAGGPAQPLLLPLFHL